MCAIDRLHPISGVINKLEGYRQFLRNNASHRNSVCLIQMFSYADIQLVREDLQANPQLTPNTLNESDDR